MTGNDAAAKRDVLTALTTRFPPARVVVAETYVQGPRAAPAIVEAIGALCEIDDVDVIVLARGGGSFEDLLPFSDERLVRVVASCPVPIVSAVGHEQDTPLTDLAADVRASTPSVAARLVVPDADELRERLEQTRDRLRRAPLLTVERKRSRLDGAYGRLRALSPPPRSSAGTPSSAATGGSSGAPARSRAGVAGRMSSSGTGRLRRSRRSDGDA